MNSCTANFDSDHGIQDPHSGLKGLQVGVFVGEDSELACADTHTNSSVNIFLGGLEPCISLGLIEHFKCK